MRYVAAYLLAQLSGNKNPSLDDIQKILGSVGIDADGESAKVVINAMKGKNVEELIEKGKLKLAAIPSGGAAVSASAAAPSGGAAAAGAPAKEEKKEEKKKEEKEESDDDMGFGLFD